MSIDEFFHETLLDNVSAVPSELEYKFSELVCGDNTQEYRNKVIEFIKAPYHSKDMAKRTKSDVVGGDTETAEKIKLLYKNIKLLEEICNSEFNLFKLSTYIAVKNHSAKNSYILLYWILQQFITWPKKPEFYTVAEIKKAIIYFANRVKKDMVSHTRYNLIHECNPERFATLGDVENYQQEFSTTFALAGVTR